MNCPQKRSGSAPRNFHPQCRPPRRLHRRLRIGAAAILSLLLLGLRPAAQAQAAPPGRQGTLKLSAGVLGSADMLEYGSRRMLGTGVFVDAESTGHLGAEAEGRWIEFHQTANVHAEAYSMGGRYHFDCARFQPYIKVLAGFARFNFPYNYAHGRYFTVTAGGGVDYHWRHRINLRIADFEYQDWPQFSFGSMSAVHISAGVEARIF